jgi:hypothetical protein
VALALGQTRKKTTPKRGKKMLAEIFKVVLLVANVMVWGIVLPYLLGGGR